jgi:hypothetical protein
MSKILLILGCSVLVLASCSSDNTFSVQQAQIDSTVNAIVAKHEAENTAKKDSILNAIEKQKADSITKMNEPKQQPGPSK